MNKKMVLFLAFALAPGCTDSYGTAGTPSHHGEVASGGEHHDDDHDGDHDGDHDDHDHDEDSVANVTPEQAAHVLILQNTQIDRATEALGTVDVHTSGEAEETALNRLRARAASLGADAVLGVEFHHGDTGPTHLSGMAVRYRDLLGGRTYDVVGRLDVHMPMGHDHHALSELQEQGRALHADLIINIAFHHGDDPHGPTELTGDAIRYRQ